MPSNRYFLKIYNLFKCQSLVVLDYNGKLIIMYKKRLEHNFPERILYNKYTIILIQGKKKVIRKTQLKL